jgi:methyl-accepting chemotaxis protein
MKVATLSEQDRQQIDGLGKKKMRLLVALAGLAISFALPSFAQQKDTTAPPESEQAKQIVALVEKASALIDSNGQSIFPEFRKTASEWRTDDTYLFIQDLKGNVLFNGGFPKLEGTNVSGRKEVVEFVKVVQSKGSGWVAYLFPKPGQSQPSQKWSYVKAVNIDGTPGLVGAGFYPQ